MFKFRISTMFQAMIPISMICLWWSIMLANRPLTWTVYSSSQVQHEIDAGKTVVIFFRADWDLMSQIHQRRLEQAKNFKQRTRRSSVSLFEVDFTRPNRSSRLAFEKFGVRDRSTIIFLHQKLLAPIVLDDVFQEQDLIEALDQVAQLKRLR